MESLELRNAEQESPQRRPASSILKALVARGSSRTPSPTKADPTTESPSTSRMHFSPSKMRSKSPSGKASSSNQAVLGEIQQNRGRSHLPPRKKLFSNEASAPQRGNIWSSHQNSPSVDMGLKSPVIFKEKENTTPPASIVAQDAATPIWAQFASRPLEKHTQDITSTLNLSPRKPNSASSLAPHVHRNDVASRSSVDDITKQELRIHEKPSRSRVKEAVAMFNGRNTNPPKSGDTRCSAELDEALEAVLAAQNIPQNIRESMRTVDARIKEDFIKNAGLEPAKPNNTPSSFDEEIPSQSSRHGRSRSKIATLIRGRSASRGVECENIESNSPSKRSRSKTRTWGFGKGDGSPSKRARSNSRPRSLMSLKNFSSSSVNSFGADVAKETKEKSAASIVPEDFIDYLREQRKPEGVEVGRLHKLRILLRNESITWVDSFVAKRGMDELVELLGRILQMEWREEHEDLLLHEVLLCMKALCTTQKALDRLDELESSLVPQLLHMLFDEERKGPSEYSTRGVVITIIFTHLAAAKYQNISHRVRGLLKYLADPMPGEDDGPVGFISQMHSRRPYQLWCKEVSSVAKEVFWIFLHHHNVVALPTTHDAVDGAPYIKRHFPRERPPVPAAPYVGGVEWEATNYLASHLDLLNGIVASLETKMERNELRSELAKSGFEDIMGGTLRLCKEKFYGAVHDGLRTWCAAAAEDGWDTKDVRTGPLLEQGQSEQAGSAPKLDVLDFKLDAKNAGDDKRKMDNDHRMNGWL